ncbi:MAG: hypothetical protein CMN06_08410 [Roseibacillus sp.]|nr:hypothetical protein [Roseibacillus sp.]
MPAIKNWWVEPLEKGDDPLSTLRDILQRFIKRVEGEVPETGFLFNGSPICNFAVEMSPLDEGFRTRLCNIYEIWRDSICNALKRGQEKLIVRSDIEPADEASFLVAIMEGGASVGKVDQNITFLRACIHTGQNHLDSLSASQTR